MSPKTKNRIERMKQSILTFLKGVKAVSEQYFMIVSVIAVLWGGFTMYHNWSDSNKTLQNNVKSIMETQKVQTKTDSTLLIHQTEMAGQLDAIQKTTNSLQKSYVQYISNDKTLTKQDFLRYMEGLSFDVKKNSLTSDGTASYQKLTPSLK
jgi:hypothetical protein